MLFSYDCSLKLSFSFCLNSTVEPYNIIAKLGTFFMSHPVFVAYSCLACTVLCVTLQVVELTSTDTASHCQCRRCAAPICRQLCQRDCLRCCKCCVYFDLRVGRRSATKTGADVSRCPNDRPHHRSDTAAASCKRSRRRLPVLSILWLLLSSVDPDWPQRLTCGSMDHGRPSSPLDTFNR